MRRGTRKQLVVWLCVALLTAALLPPAAATPIEKCNPTPKVGSSFCVTSEIGVGTQARDPLALTLSLTNTSTSFADDTSKWISTVGLTLDPPGDGAFGVASSQSLPDNLVIAGAGTCTSADGSGCAATGTARVQIGSPFSDTYDATIRIYRLTNINPPEAGLRAQYQAAGQVCVNAIGSPCGDIAFPVNVPVGSASSFDMDFMTRFQGTISGATYDAAVSTLSMGISGVSDKVWNGSTTEAVPQVRVLSLPGRCGNLTARGSASTGEATPRTVTATTLLPVTGCPVARFNAQPDGFVARFNGSASTAVEGRNIAEWRWTFGDGTSKTTTTPTVAHTYKKYGNHEVTLVVLDSENARSAALTKTVKGTTTAVNVDKTDEKVRAFGAVSPNHAGEDVRVRLQRKRDGVFRTVETNTPALSDTSRYTTRFDRPAAGRCRVRATFPGDSDHLGSRASKAFDC